MSVAGETATVHTKATITGNILHGIDVKMLKSKFFKNVKNVTEINMIIAGVVLKQCQRVTDEQTDGRIYYS